MRGIGVRGVVLLAVCAAGLVAASAADAAVVGKTPVPSWQANGNVTSVTVSGNVAYLGGQFTAMFPAGSTGAGSVTRNGAAAVDLDTGALLPWNPDVSGTVDAIAVSGGNVYLGGSFKTVGGTARKNLAEVSATTGALVTAFHAPNPNKAVRAIAVSGANVYVGGSFLKMGATALPYAAEVDAASGALNPAWAPVVDGEVHAIALDAGSTRVVLGGFFNHLNGASSISIGAVDPATGASVPWAWHGPYFPFRPFQVLAFAQDGNSLFAAGTGNGGSFMSFDIQTGALNYIGGTDGNVVGVGVVDGVLYAGGHFTHYCGLIPGNNFCAPVASRDKLIAVDEATGALEPWHPAVNTNLGIFAMAAGDSSVVIGGQFTKAGGVAQQRFAQFHE